MVRHPVVKGLLFGGVLAISPRPLRRWMLSMLALAIAIIYTVESPSDYYDPNSIEPYSDSYRFPWYCIALIVTFVVWGIFGYIRATILTHRYYAERRANGETLSQRVRAFTNSRVLIAVDGTQRPPQGYTGPSPVPTAPKPKPAAPAPSSPMGSNLPAMWVPTYSGSAKPVQRMETTLDGTVVNDHRRVDPDEL